MLGIGILSVLANIFIASASITNGLSDFKFLFKNFKTKSLVDFSVESPQPIETAVYFEISFKFLTASLGIVHLSELPRFVKIISGVFEAIIESAWLSVARQHNPAPTFRADIELKNAAPG